MKKCYLLLTLSLLLGFTAFAQSGTIYYVKQNGDDTKDGKSWASAYANLHKALDVAQAGAEIWVAKGTYYPRPKTSFAMKNEVAIYGGFLGDGTESSLTQRDWENNQVILTNNFYLKIFFHANLPVSLNATAILDGFIIKGGQGDFGGGMYNVASSPTINNCTFLENVASDGGGMYNFLSNPVLNNCVFMKNSTDRDTPGLYGGGGMANDRSNPTLTNCSFIENASYFGGFDASGGGISNYSSNPILINCLFRKNTSVQGGGGMSAYLSNPIIKDCRFVENEGSRGGGIYSRNSNLNISICTFMGNKAVSGSSGGGICLLDGSSKIYNCSFLNNEAPAGGGLYVNSVIEIVNCRFVANRAVGTNSNFAGKGAAIMTFGGAPNITNSSFTNNYAETAGAGIFNYESNAKIVNSIFWGNIAPLNKEVHNENQSNPIVQYSIVQGGYTGTGNLDVDPQFQNPATGNLQLAPGSPAIDMGLNIANTTSTDLEGNPRIINCKIDLGAYEYRDNSATITWRGCTSTDWNTASNWSSGTVPNASNDVIISSANNQPIVSTSGAMAKSVRVENDATLTIGTTGELVINGFTFVRGSSTAFANFGTVFNSGALVIGNNASAGSVGLWNFGTFKNEAGQLSIDNTLNAALENTSGIFTNNASIFIGTNAGVGGAGLVNAATFNNHGGQINIDNATGIGLLNNRLANFSNKAVITIGNKASVGIDGLSNYGNFTNDGAGQLYIDNATGTGLSNIAGTFTNNATVTIGEKYVVGAAGLYNGTGSFTNSSCAILSVFAPLDNNGSFVNAGLFTSTTPGTHQNSGFINAGVLVYPMGNPIPNVTNEGVIANPLTGCGTKVAHALQVATNSAYAVGSSWYSDVDLQQQAGTYTNNTFIASGPGTGATTTLYFAINNGSCQQTVSIPVTLNPQPNLIITNPALVCSPATVNLTAPAVTNGSTLPNGTVLSYFSDAAATQTVTNPAQVGTGTYYIKAQAGECFDLQPVVVSVNPAIIANASVTSNYNGAQVSCFGRADGQITLTASGGTGTLSYSLDGVSTNNTGVFSNLAAAVYTYRVTDANGCVKSAPIELTQPAKLEVTETHTDIGCLIGGISNVTIKATGGTQPYSFTQQAQGGSTNSTGLFTQLPITQYSYQVTDKNGCSAALQLAIQPNDFTAPSFSRPADITIAPSQGSNCYNALPSVTGNVTNANDDKTLASSLLVTYTDVVSTCGYSTIIKRTWHVEDGCRNAAPDQVQTITVTDNKTPYIVFATKEAKFGKGNTINGSVGVSAADGKASFDRDSKLLAPEFVKAASITKDATATINTQYTMPATNGPTPVFYPFAGITKGLGNYTVSTSTTVPINANYEKLTIKKGVTVTIGGTLYGDINIEDGAQVTFAPAGGIINIEELKIKDAKEDAKMGDAGDRPNRILFSQCTSVRIKNKVEIGKNTKFNVDGPRVTIYLGDDKNDEEKFTVSGGNTEVQANVYLKNGKLKVNGNDNQFNFNTIMTGWYIVEKLESTGKNVQWNRNACNTTSTRGTEAGPGIVRQPVQNDYFAVKALPNPSTTNFRLLVQSYSSEPVTIRISDRMGRVVSVQSNVQKNSVIMVGNNLLNGTYFAEVLQGKHRQVVQLVKLK